MSLCSWLKSILASIKQGIGINETPNDNEEVEPVNGLYDEPELEDPIIELIEEVPDPVNGLSDEVESIADSVNEIIEEVPEPVNGLSDIIDEEVPEIRALIVGISKYESSENNIEGCDRDALLFKNMLINNYDCSNIKFLINEEATKNNIISGLDWLCSDTSKDDILIYYHSGHGTQVLDNDGDEIDYLDEVLVTHDFDYDNILRDDIIHSYFAKINPEARVYFICDTCFSGTMDRSINIKNKLAKVDKFIPRRIKSIDKTTKSVMKIRSTPLLSNTLLLSGCQENETSVSVEFEEGWYGALTYCIVKVLENDPNLTWKQLASDVSDILAYNGFDQHPNLVGSDDIICRVVFK